MNVFRLKNVFFLALLSSLFVISCATDDDKNPGENDIGENDTVERYEDYFEFTVSGEINESYSEYAEGTIGRIVPQTNSLADGLSQLILQDWKNGTESDDFTYELYFSNNRVNMHSPMGNELYPVKTTYRVVNEYELFDDASPSFHVYFHDKETGLTFGGKALDRQGKGKSNGEIILLKTPIEDDLYYTSGTFELEAFLEGDESKSILVKGKFGRSGF